MRVGASWVDQRQNAFAPLAIRGGRRWARGLGLSSRVCRTLAGRPSTTLQRGDLAFLDPVHIPDGSIPVVKVPEKDRRLFSATGASRLPAPQSRLGSAQVLSRRYDRLGLFVYLLPGLQFQTPQPRKANYLFLVQLLSESNLAPSQAGAPKTSTLPMRRSSNQRDNHPNNNRTKIWIGRGRRISILRFGLHMLIGQLSP